MSNLSISDMVEKVNTLEAGLLQLPQADCPVRHIFGDGIYIREVILPAGHVAIGHHQNLPHMNIMVRGVVSIVNEDGTISTLDAREKPITFMGKAGRKVGYIHEEVVWHNVYPTEEKDIETLEKTYLTKSETFNQVSAEKLLALKSESEHEDFLLAIESLGVTPEQVRLESENEADQIPFPNGEYKCMVSDSIIEGKGLFATSGIERGECICPARIGDKRTPAGRFTNHARHPNAIAVIENGDVYLYAVRDIAGMKGGIKGEEITINYYDTRLLICQA